MPAPQATSLPVLALALKPENGGPMQEVESAEALPDGGLKGSVRPSAQRGITFLASRQWAAAQAELGGSLPWHTRRANVLLDADRLGDLLGLRVQVGAAVVDLTGETKPCDLMDQFQPGLRTALKPELRGGIFGRVVTGGAIRVGDALRVLGPIPSDAPSVTRPTFRADD